jgi:ubiquinone/menaquinone biosynthesis C-methylase UbiE
MAKNFNLDARGKLLDLGCGTGELSIPIEKYFEKVTAIEPDGQMLQEDSRKANNLMTNNIDGAKDHLRA